MARPRNHATRKPEVTDAQAVKQIQSENYKPTVNQLMQAIQSVPTAKSNYHSDPTEFTKELLILKHAESEARNAVEHFEKNDRIYNGLKLRAAEANKKYERARSLHYKTVRLEIQRLENLVRIDGPVPSTVKAVRAFVEKFLK